MNVFIKKGLGSDGRYYVALEGITLVISRQSMFQLGLAFFHIAMGNRTLDGTGELVDVSDLRVYVLGGPYHRKSSKSPMSSNHQNSAQTHTRRWVSWLLCETSLGSLLLALLEKGLGLAVVEADWLADQPACNP